MIENRPPPPRIIPWKHTPQRKTFLDLRMKALQCATSYNPEAVTHYVYLHSVVKLSHDQAGKVKHLTNTL